MTIRQIRIDLSRARLGASSPTKSSTEARSKLVQILKAEPATFSQMIPELDLDERRFVYTLVRDHLEEQQALAFFETAVRLDDIPSNWGILLEHVTAYGLFPAYVAQSVKVVEVFWKKSREGKEHLSYDQDDIFIDALVPLGKSAAELLFKIISTNDVSISIRHKDPVGSAEEAVYGLAEHIAPFVLAELRDKGIRASRRAREMLYMTGELGARMLAEEMRNASGARLRDFLNCCYGFRRAAEREFLIRAVLELLEAPDRLGLSPLPAAGSVLEKQESESVRNRLLRFFAFSPVVGTRVREAENSERSESLDLLALKVLASLSSVPERGGDEIDEPASRTLRAELIQRAIELLFRLLSSPAGAAHRELQITRVGDAVSNILIGAPSRQLDAVGLRKLEQRLTHGSSAEQHASIEALSSVLSNLKSRQEPSSGFSLFLDTEDIPRRSFKRRIQEYRRLFPLVLKLFEKQERQLTKATVDALSQFGDDAKAAQTFVEAFLESEACLSDEQSPWNIQSALRILQSLKVFSPRSCRASLGIAKAHADWTTRLAALEFLGASGTRDSEVLSFIDLLIADPESGERLVQSALSVQHQLELAQA